MNVNQKMAGISPLGMALARDDMQMASLLVLVLVLVLVRSMRARPG